jgi:hypothetical protein
VRSRSIAAIVLVAAAMSCTKHIDLDTLTADGAARYFGACHQRVHGDGPGSVNVVADVERWLEVRSPSPALSDRDLLDGRKSVTIELDVESIDGEGARTGRRATSSIFIGNDTMAGIAWALRHGHRAFLAMTSTGLERETVFYVLVRHVDGSFFFVGNCAYDLFTSLFQRRLGSEYTAAMADIVGETDRATILRLLGEPVDAVVDQPLILSPGDVDQSILDAMDLVSLAFDVPDAWLGIPYGLCTHVAAGWNDCAALGSTTRSPIELGAYLSDDRQLEVWLLGLDGDPRHPIEWLGTVDLVGVRGTPIRIALTGTVNPSGNVPPISGPTARLVEG